MAAEKTEANLQEEIATGQKLAALGKPSVNAKELQKKAS